MAANKTRFIFLWKIENFSMLPHQKGERLVSPTFVVDSWKETKWFLTLYPRGSDELEIDDHVSLFFLKTEEDLELTVNYTITLESKASVIRKGNNYLIKSGCGYVKFIRLIDLYDKKKLFLPNDILTLRFELSRTDENSEDTVIEEAVRPPYSKEKICVFRTNIPVHRRSLMWRIDNVNNLGELPDNSIKVSSALKESPSFYISCKLSEFSSNDYLPIRIRQISTSRIKGRVFVKCKMTVVGAHKECQDSAESTHLFNMRLNDIFYFPSFIKTINLTTDKYFYLDDTLLLQCDFAFCYKSDLYHSEFNRIPLVFETKKLRSKTKYFQSIENLYMHGKFYDVHLQAGDKVFPAYKIMLCARSNVFTAMFEQEMKEKNSNVVKITDVEPTALKNMLDFIHFDAIEEELSHEDARKLYMASDKYNIDYLKRTCSISLMSTLSVANVCDVLSLADLHDDHVLMHAVHTFISTHSTETFHSVHWKSFMDDNPKLSMQIMLQMLNK